MVHKEYRALKFFLAENVATFDKNFLRGEYLYEQHELFEFYHFILHRFHFFCLIIGQSQRNKSNLQQFQVHLQNQTKQQKHVTYTDICNRITN